MVAGPIVAPDKIEALGNTVTNMESHLNGFGAMHKYLQQIVSSVTARFSELKFFVEIITYLLYIFFLQYFSMKRIYYVTLQHKSIDPELVQRQLMTYSFDDSFDLLYHHECQRNAVQFFVTLLTMDSYSEVANWRCCCIVLLQTVLRWTKDSISWSILRQSKGTGLLRRLLMLSCL